MMSSVAFPNVAFRRPPTASTFHFKDVLRPMTKSTDRSKHCE